MAYNSAKRRIGSTPLTTCSIPQSVKKTSSPSVSPKQVAKRPSSLSLSLPPPRPPSRSPSQSPARSPSQSPARSPSQSPRSASQSPSQTISKIHEDLLGGGQVVARLWSSGDQVMVKLQRSSSQDKAPCNRLRKARGSQAPPRPPMPARVSPPRCRATTWPPPSSACEPPSPRPFKAILQVQQDSHQLKPCRKIQSKPQVQTPQSAICENSKEEQRSKVSGERSKAEIINHANDSIKSVPTTPQRAICENSNEEQRSKLSGERNKAEIINHANDSIKSVPTTPQSAICENSNEEQRSKLSGEQSKAEIINHANDSIKSVPTTVEFPNEPRVVSASEVPKIQKISSHQNRHILAIDERLVVESIKKSLVHHESCGKREAASRLSQVTAQDATLQDYKNELVTAIEDLNGDLDKREDLFYHILNEEGNKTKMQDELPILSRGLQKSILETETKCMKIRESSQTSRLFYMKILESLSSRLESSEGFD